MADLPFCYLRSADTSVRMFDRRNLTSGGVGSPVHIFQGHNAAVLCVQVFEDYVFSAFLFLHVLSSASAEKKCVFSFLPMLNYKFCICLQWSPDKSSVFGSSAEDGILNIWDHEKV